MEIYELALAVLTAVATGAAAVAACQASKAARESARAAEIANRLELARELTGLNQMIEELIARFHVNTFFGVKRENGETERNFYRRIEAAEQKEYLDLWGMVERKRSFLSDDLHTDLMTIVHGLEEAVGKKIDYWTPERRRAMGSKLNRAREMLRGPVGGTVAGD